MAETGFSGFPKGRRLLHRYQFDQVFTQPCRAGGGGVTVLARPNGLAQPRLGLVIAKRVVRQAVSRNRIKRLAREAFRQLQAHLGGLDVIVMARPGVVDRDNPAITRALTKCLLDVVNRCNRS